eukprot:CAMPEP_0197694658 /NCGR_PEP_ID=MMETSP1338-20131121/114121_1 /TAXON_ID=43686 ORGANISM="Pelagodinium beii, Strain RCC1491" /NCGR_SAMPLE_ID=MMETSP1338 /ASSEMBLY_ACC=CAM_ASM_000754 /LENGTH=32 /DNA_ID= /DNA_START= /DNA_END= /DNA_ORIENTATION=
MTWCPSRASTVLDAKPVVPAQIQELVLIPKKT